MWTVELGRRDGRVSSADQAASLLPSSQSTAESLITQFAALGLTPRDMATLSGNQISPHPPISSFKIELARELVDKLNATS